MGFASSAHPTALIKPLRIRDQMVRAIEFIRVFVTLMFNLFGHGFATITHLSLTLKLTGKLWMAKPAAICPVELPVRPLCAGECMLAQMSELPISMLICADCMRCIGVEGLRGRYSRPRPMG